MSNWKRKTDNRETHGLTQENRESGRKKGKLEDFLQEEGTETLLHPVLGAGMWNMTPPPRSSPGEPGFAQGTPGLWQCNCLGRMCFARCAHGPLDMVVDDALVEEGYCRAQSTVTCV